MKYFLQKLSRNVIWKEHVFWGYRSGILVENGLKDTVLQIMR